MKKWCSKHHQYEGDVKLTKRKFYIPRGSKEWSNAVYQKWGYEMDEFEREISQDIQVRGNLIGDLSESGFIWGKKPKD